MSTMLLYLYCLIFQPAPYYPPPLPPPAIYYYQGSTYAQPAPPAVVTSPSLIYRPGVPSPTLGSNCKSLGPGASVCY